MNSKDTFVRGQFIKVAVIGGGIIGISSALRVLDNPHIKSLIKVEVLADQWTPHTTSDGSAGYWHPYLFGDMPYQRLRSWCKDTFDYLLDLCTSSEASTYGVGLLSSYKLSETPIETPVYSDIFLEWRPMTEKELQMYPKQYRFGAFLTTIFAECSRLLPYMMKSLYFELTRKPHEVSMEFLNESWHKNRVRIQEKGGKLVQRKVTSLTELMGEYDVIINCCGVEAAHLVPDPQVQPIRGQTIRVNAPWIKHAVTDDHHYILPNSEEVICGGTHQTGDWNTEIDPKDRDNIWRGCCNLVPSLEKARIIREWVGLRPGRPTPRLDRETLFDNEGKQKIEVIHNYGHGGSGVTLFWGCAKEVVEQLEHIINDSPPSTVRRIESHL